MNINNINNINNANLVCVLQDGETYGGLVGSTVHAVPEGMDHDEFEEALEAESRADLEPWFTLGVEPTTLLELSRLVGVMLPRAAISLNDNGQLVVNTNLRSGHDGTLIPDREDAHE